MRKLCPVWGLLLKAFLILLFFGNTSSFSEENDPIRLSLISEYQSINQDSKLLLGLQAQMAPHWKTYWRTPGVSGYGLKIDWKESHNIKSIQLLWPFPHHISTHFGAINGYEGDVVFPLMIEVKDPSQPVQVLIHVDMLACDQASCLPMTQTLSLKLPVGQKIKNPEAVLLQKALQKIPLMENTKGDEKNITLQSVDIIKKDDLPILQITLAKTKGIFLEEALPQLFLEIDNWVISKPDMVLSNDQKSIVYSASMAPNIGQTVGSLEDLDGKLITLTLSYEDQHVEMVRPLKLPTSTLSLLFSILFAAFLGGVILNIMPCVIPVLSLKILSVLRHGGGNHKVVRQEFLATAAGIIFSFFLFSGLAIFLKMSGHAIGWGIQFQNPYFLVGLSCILTLFACNLFGFFEFRLPSFLSILGNLPPQKERFIGSFLEGSLVTILATPCTAPFLGTALAFALSRRAFEIMGVFMIMGLGLSFPYIGIAFFPALATKLPKPGAWMTTVKTVLGCLMFITALWLIYILVTEIGSTGALLVGCSLFMISFFLSKMRRRSEDKRKLIWFGTSFFIGSIFILPTIFSQPPSQNQFKKDELWHPFEPHLIEGYVRDGKTVFVTVTADWCLTCQANKYFILKRKDVTKALKEKNVVLMEADWTNRNPKIANYLKSFDQYGIPFYAVYGCRTPKGTLLGQILTPQKVIQILEHEKCPIS